MSINGQAGRIARIFHVLSQPPERRWPQGFVHHGSRIALIVVVSLLLTLAFPPIRTATLARYEAGAVLDEDVVAQFPFSVPKTQDELDEDRAEAAAAVPVTFRYVASAGDSTAAALNRFFAELEGAFASDGGAGPTVEGVLEQAGIVVPPEQTRILRDSTTLEQLHRAAVRVARDLIPAGVVDASETSLLATGRLKVLLDDGTETSVARDSVLTPGRFYSRAGDMLPASAPPELSELLRLIIIRYRQFSYVPDLQRTEAERDRARRAVSTTKGNVLAGEIVAPASRALTPEDVERLNAYQAQLRTRATDELTGSLLFPSLGAMVVNFLLLGAFGLVLYFFRLEIYSNFRWIFLMAVLVGAYFAAAMAIDRLDVFPPELLPVAFVALPVAVLWDSRIALILVLVVGILTVAQPPFFDFQILGSTVIGGAAAAMSVRVVRRRAQTWTFIALIALAYAVFLAASGLIRGFDAGAFVPALGWTTANAIFSALVAMGFLPVFEWFTRITTDQTLLEWADPNRPLLKRLALEAPGTYHHTISVANLAEAAANAIGANGLLCRVGVYYHDVGKMLKPQFFVENQPEGRNPHDKMKPATSAAIVREHVLEGLRLAREHGVPDVIADFIVEHHGTQLIGFFYEKAKEEGDQEPDPAAFSYPGPLPRSRETAIVLLADPVESAARALQDPTPERIRGLIDSIVESKVKAGQLDDAPLTLREVAVIKAQFAKVVEAMFHHRIDYPATKHLTDAPTGPSEGEEEAVDDVEGAEADVGQGAQGIAPTPPGSSRGAGTGAPRS